MIWSTVLPMLTSVHKRRNHGLDDSLRGVSYKQFNAFVKVLKNRTSTVKCPLPTVTPLPPTNPSLR